jgi:hypothetical protein
MFSRLLAVCFMALALVGCASVTMGDPKQDTALKAFPAAKPGTAGVYIYRNETFGAAMKLDVAMDGQPLGQTAAKTYFYKEVAPGKHTVVSKGETTDTLEFNAVAGKLYFVWQEVKMGVMSARTKLQLVSDDVGRKGVTESQLAASK